MKVIDDLVLRWRWWGPIGLSVIVLKNLTARIAPGLTHPPRDDIDLQLGTETQKAVDLSDYDIVGVRLRDAHRHEATSAIEFGRALRNSRIDPARFTFID